MHSHLSLRIKVTPALLACALGLFSGSVIAAENWQTLPPTKVGAAITDQIESHPDLTYARYGERALQLDLFRPRNADKPLPAIVCIHGGGWQSGNRLNHGHLAKALAARGFVAVSISYRLSGEAKFPAQIHDAKAAVRWLRANAKQWGIDPDAIGATGLSAGGHLAALLATSGGVAEIEGDGGNAKFSSAIQAAVPMGAQSDFMSERNREISRTADIWQQFLGGSQEDVPGVYRLASPRSHLDPKDPPTLFISGELDDASTHADEMRRECMAFGIPSGLLVIPGAPHPFLTKQAFFDIAIDRLDAFFSLHLKRKGIPAIPVGATQPAKENKFSTNVQIPQLAFAAQELDAALKEAGREDLQVTLIVKPDAASPEAFEIKASDSHIEVIGADATGAMYGGIEVAEHLKLGLPLKNVSRTPFLEKRGIKFNIPLDVRNPSYDDSGDAAQENIANMWDFEGFWKPYIDQLARYRYNTLSLWSCHPYPQMVKLKDYPDCAAQDVYRAKAGALNHESKGRYFTRIFMMMKGERKWVDGCLDTNGDGHLTPEDGTIELVKKMTIDEKIAHWTKVFKHAEDRGIQVTLFHWNVNVHGAKGHYGIEADQTNPKTIAYQRAAVKELILTYPAITAIGVAAGETDDEELKGDDSTEAFIFKTYGLGVMDALKERPDRKIRFIWRNHSTEMKDVEEQFTSKYTGGPVDVEVKYVVGRIHSSRRPQEWEKRAIKAGWLGEGYRIWLNIRNDDLFMHRWGSPDYVRQFIRNMPLESTPGFMMGSDGYVWGKVFYSTVPELQDQLEIDKHWYNFRMWGEMAYNNELGDEYWTAALKQHFGLDAQSAKLLHDTWQTISEVVPQINRAVYEGTDFALAPEGCMSGGTTATGFLTIPAYYYGEGQPSLRRLPQPLRNPPPTGEKPCISIPDWGKAYMASTQNKFGEDKLTPLQVADNLDRWADAVDAALPELQSKVGGNVELRDLIWDIESMALLGRYYADKQRCAAKYWVYRESGFAATHNPLHQEAIAHIQEAQRHWEAYAAILDKHYKPQLLARTHYLDWNSILNNGMKIQAAHFGVKREVQDIINKAYPKKEQPQKKSKK